jgi:DNA-binding SARP family transcriptional activator
MTEVRVLGAVSAWRGEQELELGGPRQRAVLGLLVAAGSRVVSTDRLVEDLWDGEPPPKALGALQAYVSNLRRLLEPDRLPREPARVLVSAAPGYRLALPREAVDAWRFAALVAEAGRAEAAQALALVDEALALWRDEPYAGYVGQGWADLDRTRLTDLHSVAVETRAAAALQLGRTGEAVPSLEDHVRRHPLREHAVALLALGLYRLGRQADALARIADARRVLADELGLDPGAELRRLEEDVLAQRPSLEGEAVVRTTSPAGEQPSASTGSQDAPGAEPDGFVGREDELARLRTALDRPGPVVVWVEGEAGQGKSALLDRFLRADAGDRRRARGRCSEVDGAPPGWAWQQVLAQLDPSAPVPVGAFATAQAVLDALADAPGPAVIGLDDLHRADQGTLQILRQLLATGPEGLVLVATFRSDEVSSDLRSTLAATAAATADRLVLGGLDAEAARRLVREQLGADLTRRTLDLLLERSRASPMLLRQLVSVVSADGPAAAERELPVAVREALRLRLDRLPVAVVDQLARASVVGRDVDVDLLLRLDPGRPSEDELLDALDAGVVAGLVEVTDTGPRFVHALVRDALYERLPPLRRTRLHQAALTALVETRPSALSAIAHHASAGLDATTAPGALDHLLPAADAALAQGAVHDAIAHLRTALRAERLAGAPERRTLRLHRRLVDALAQTGDISAARAARAESLAAAERCGTVLDRACAWHLEMPSLLPLRATVEVNDDAVEAVQRVLAELGDLEGAGSEVGLDPRVRARTLLALIREGEPWRDDVVAPAADEVAATAGALDDPLLTCQALNAQYLSPRANREADFLLEVGERMLATARAAGLLAYEALARTILAAEAVGRGDLRAAAEQVERGVRVATTGQLHTLLVAGEIFTSTEHLLAGRLGAARRSFAGVARQLALDGDPNAATSQLFCDFTVAHAGGDATGLRDGVRAFAATRPREAHDLLVSTLLDGGDASAARAAYDPAPWPEDATWMFSTALAVENAYRLGDAADADRAYERLSPFSGQLARSRNGALVLGPVDHFLGLAAALAGRPGAARAHLGRAQEQASDLGPALWRTRMEAALAALPA